MNTDESLGTYIDAVYGNLSSEELFSRAKEFAWQTFFHHSLSVALISHRIGSFIKKNAVGISREALKAIEERLKLKYEDILFLSGIAHDYIKLHGIKGSTGEERVKRLLNRLTTSLFILSPKDRERLTSLMIAIARAVEGIYDPELEEEYIRYIANVVRIADELMGMSSVDEALSYLQTSRDIEELAEEYNLKTGFIKISTPSILQAKVSEEIIKVLRKNGWVPLVAYADGVILIGASSLGAIPMREVTRIIKSEIERAFKTKEKIKEIIRGLRRLSLRGIYSKLTQTGGETLLPVNEEKLKRMDRETLEAFYHNTITKYLRGIPISELNKEITDIKTRLRKRGALIDPRRLATGIRGGSTYFNEELSTMVITKENLANLVSSISNSEERFLILAYIIAFPSKEESVTINILKEVGVVIPSDIDKELIRIIAIAEAYRHATSTGRDAIKKLVETTYEGLGGSEGIDYYASRFTVTRLKSNIVSTDAPNPLNILNKGLIEGKSYCRVCGEPILKQAIAFIQYSHAVGRRGGASEIWLHDDPPLASIEGISTNKKTRIRYICPLCFYEAVQFRGRSRPPIFVIALHPVVAYDLWSYLKNRLAYLANLYELLRRRGPLEVALMYEDLLRHDLKVTPNILSRVSEIAKPGRRGDREERLTVLFDDLGARVLLPLGKDMSLKRKNVATALLLAPFVMSLSGGGQVGLAGTFGDTYNLGLETTPVITPHPTNLLMSIVRSFEEVRRNAKNLGRQMNLTEYSVYNKSYITLLKALYIYGLKVFGWFNLWRRNNPGKEIQDYALAILEHASAIPYVPLALDAPPPSRLDPRARDEALPFYGLISFKSLEVETHMAQVPKVLEGKETPSLNKLLYRYAVSLKELDSSLSRYKVQRPLRKGIEILLQYSSTIGEADAKGIAMDKFLELVASSAGVDIEKRKKKVKDERGMGREISYRAVFFEIFSDIVDIVVKLKKELPPSQLRKFIEVMLDSAFEKYRYARTGGG